MKVMKSLAVCAVIVVGAVGPSAHSVSAQQDRFDRSSVGDCVQQFVDGHGWVSFRNTCSEAISLRYCIPTSGCYETDLGGQRETTTTRSPSEFRGATYGACRKNLLAVDAQDKAWQGNGKYWCQY